MYDLTLTLIQYGANPNIVASGGVTVPALTGPPSQQEHHHHGGYHQGTTSVHLKNQVLFPYCQILINKDQLLYDQEQTFTRWVVRVTGSGEG